MTLKKKPEDLTFTDLRFHFGTGRSFIRSGSGKDAVRGYRSGVMTDVGDIEESEWRCLMEDLIKRSGEENIQQQLRRWAKDHCAWLHTKQEIEMYALELHSSRIFENPKWVDYKLFSEKYMSHNTLCEEQECEPPYGGREDCEFHAEGVCLAR